ncbi:FAD/NAD(P)-binding protein [Nonomuraea sp. NEAU-A123]|uniref:FAD/NAD(P)-binding protein n=1 Tax=Nonomuraea sp. NEAU-A123 TaxID=2839649 RepID=UPI001BE41F1A|nr:FAD/NAD(P)-binding protein [Nonomuraea sp. NEAU-A123]MBT2231886.1 FAD/NAD(P)-binding protein [Nonomuraea sp. NEAU-A123]
MRTPSVAVVGGGASGALTAIHLLRLARTSWTPVAVTLLDQHGRHALGQAYATTDPHHLLNTRADRMSALHDEPDHLLTWARIAGLDVNGSSYLPRTIYGRYLRDVLTVAEDPPNRPLHRVTATAVALDGDHAVRLANGRRIDADAVVLALGNRSPAPVPGLIAHPRYVADPWAGGALTGIGDGAPVLVLGTGLTMVDVALTVTRAHPGTVVYALSRHALLPRPHLPQPASPVPVTVPDEPLRVADLLATTRRAVRESGGDWHGVMEGLRPHAQALWRRLGPGERRLFLRRVARYWEIHRHRIPPASAAAIADLRARGRLRLLRGSLIETKPAAGGLRVRADLDGTMTDLDVGWLVNATGPSADVTTDPFLASLITAGMARPDPLRLGLDAGPDGAVLDAAGRPSDRLFTLGPLLRGTLYETTAVPEIRAQAAALAPRLVEVAASHAARAQSVA